MLDRLAYFIAAGAGAGFIPVAPGTFGAIESVLVFILIAVLAPGWSLALVAVLNVIVFAVGVWASSRACAIRGVEDPSQVVIDEVSGQLIALTPIALAPTAVGIIVAFVLFRLIDIFKPYPIRRLEHLRAGWGVMCDDALAGVYAAALVWTGRLAGLI
jgi:phosphatidylglycerophosphatase A